MCHPILRSLWNDEAGAVITAEMTLVMSILVLGLVSGLEALRSATVGQLENIAGQIQDVGNSGGFRRPPSDGNADNLVVGGNFDVPIRGGQFRSIYEGQYVAPSECIYTAESEFYWASVRK
jgi:glyoxylate utilization-related uncharacterized protein